MQHINYTCQTQDDTHPRHELHIELHIEIHIEHMQGTRHRNLIRVEAKGIEVEAERAVARAL